MKPKSTKKITYRANAKYQAIPCLIIEGLFLNRLGFHLGDQVSIKYEHQRIVISK